MQIVFQVLIFIGLTVSLVFAYDDENLNSYQLNESQAAQIASLIKTNTDAQNVYEPLRKLADKALSETPDPIEKIQSEGKLDKDPVKIATQASLRDMNKIYALSIVWLISKDPQYAEKTKQFILSWAKMNKATGDPIDETNLENIIQAYDFMKAQFSMDERKVISQWLTGVANAEILSQKPGKTTSMNNWNSHRIKIVGLIGFVFHDQRFVNFAEQSYRDQISVDLLPDGSSFDFQERDALHYHCYTLEPLLSISIASKINGSDWFSFISTNGSSLGKSMEFLLPYVQGEITHAEFVNSKVQFDRKRAAAGQKHFKSGRLFEPREALPALEEYYFFDHQILEVVQKILKTQSVYPSWQILVESVQSSGK